MEEDQRTESEKLEDAIEDVQIILEALRRLEFRQNAAQNEMIAVNDLISVAEAKLKRSKANLREALAAPSSPRYIY